MSIRRRITTKGHRTPCASHGVERLGAAIATAAALTEAERWAESYHDAVSFSWHDALHLDLGPWLLAVQGPNPP